ncbi:MAG: DUF3352 domain-containing protein, partial [bacterium]
MLLVLSMVISVRASAADLPLESMVPLNTPGVIAVDPSYLWKNSSNIRKEKEVSNGIGKLENTLGISIENDILPWAGQVAVSFTGNDGNIPNGIILVQIRDQGIFLQKMMILQSAIEKTIPTAWQTGAIKGTPVRQTQIPNNATVTTVSMAVMNGWVVITVGNDLMQQVIDAAKGDAKSIKDHPLFTKSTADQAAGTVGRLFLNGDGFWKLMQKFNPDVAQALRNAEFDKEFTATTVTENGNGLDIDKRTCSSSLKTQEELKQLRSDTGVVTGKSLALLPAGTFITVLLNNPTRWVDFLENKMFDSLNPAVMMSLEGQLNKIAYPRHYLKQITGELALSGAYRDDKGFSAILAGGTKSAADANYLAQRMKGIAQQMNVTVDTENDISQLTDAAKTEQYLKFLPCWTTRDKWLLISSHPDWITAPTLAKPPELPAAAKEASIYAFGNFDFVPKLMDSMNKDNPQGVAEMNRMLTLTNYQPGGWSIAMNIAEDGGAVRTKSHITSGIPLVMAAVVLPVFANAREKARQASSMANLRQIAVAILINSQEHDDHLPTMNTPDDLRKLDITDNILKSPRNNERYLPNPFLSGKSLGDKGIVDVTAMVLAFESTSTGGNRIVAFLDGHCEIIPDARWEQLKKASKIP